MAKSAQIVRDVLISAQPSKDSHEPNLIEYEERIAIIQAWCKEYDIFHRVLTCLGVD